MKASRLKSDPAKTAAWQQRGRAKGLDRGKGLERGGATLERSPLKRGKARLRRSRLKVGDPSPRVSTPPEVWLQVLKRDKGRCVWSCHLGVRGKAQHPHHLLGKSVWPQYVALRENIVGLTADLHMTHEHSPNDRLPWAALPAECREFLMAVAAHDERARRLIETKYPAVGERADHPIRRAV